jgi:hypothetical protein
VKEKTLGIAVVRSSIPAHQRLRRLQVAFLKVIAEKPASK